MASLTLTQSGTNVKFVPGARQNNLKVKGPEEVAEICSKKNKFVSW